MPKRKEILVDDFSSLTLHIYIVGYPVEGESILGMFKNGKKTLFTFLIDSYINEDDWYSHVDHLLNQEYADGIDMFIWTHPDTDHSLDIPRLLDTYDKKRKAHVYLPDIEHLKGVKPVIDATRSYLYNKYSQKGSQKYQVSVVSVDKDEEARTLFTLVFKDKRLGFPQKLACKFCFLSPISQFVDRGKHFDMQTGYNTFSVVLALNINGSNLLFCGDLEDKSARLIDEGFLHNVVYLKIPHHTSRTTKDFFIRMLSVHANDVVATTTVFRRKNLPDAKLLKSYEKICKELYCTGSKQGEKFGCIETKFNLLDMNSASNWEGSGELVYKKVNTVP